MLMGNKNMSINTLILDFGGVISKTLFETHRQTEKTLGLKSGSLTWQGPFNLDTDDLWQDMQNDLISEREYWLKRTQQVANMLGTKWTQMEDFVKACRSKNIADCIRPEFLHTLEKVKTHNKKIAILSNELDLFYGADFRNHLPFLQDIDTIIDCTYLPFLKPDKRAYELVCDTLQVKPYECVFVDDQYRNIVGAENIKMHTVHFDIITPAYSYNQALQKLCI